MPITIIAIGKMKEPEAALAADYVRRLRAPLAIIEHDVKVRDIQKAKEAEGQKILSSLPKGAFIVALDPLGRDISSEELANLMPRWAETGGNKIAFIIGGADGLAESMLATAHYKLSLGKKIWPHMLARIMLLEQIYRAEQIIAGTPYHRG
jgi:23S rRNA (pseudouridine1915-N3)-methyltransferase